MKPSKFYLLAGHWTSCVSVTSAVSINGVAEAGKVSCIYKGIKYDEKSVLIIRILIKNVKVLNINRVYCQCLALWDKKALYRRSWFLSAPSWGGSSCTRWQCPAEADTSDRSGRKQTLEFSNQLFFSYKGSWNLHQYSKIQAFDFKSWFATCLQHYASFLENNYLSDNDVSSRAMLITPIPI